MSKRIPKELQKRIKLHNKYMEEFPNAKIHVLANLPIKHAKNESPEQKKAIQQEIEHLTKFNEQLTNRHNLTPGCDPACNSDPDSLDQKNWEANWKYVRQMERKTVHETDQLLQIISLFNDVYKPEITVIFVREDISLRGQFIQNYFKIKIKEISYDRINQCTLIGF